MTPSAGTTTPLMKRCPSSGAIWYSHRLAATLQRPRPSCQPPVRRLPRLNHQGLGLPSVIERQKHFLQAKAAPDLFFFKEKLVFPPLEEAGAFCLAPSRLPMSRCAQSVHPRSPERTSLRRERAGWSPPTLFTQINERSLNRNAFSSTAAEAVFQPVTHPLLEGLKEKP